MKKRRRPERCFDSQPLFVASLLRKQLGDKLPQAIADVLPKEANTELSLAQRRGCHFAASSRRRSTADCLMRCKRAGPGGAPPDRYVGADDRTLASRGRFMLRLCGDAQNDGQGLIFGEADVKNLLQ